MAWLKDSIFMLSVDQVGKGSFNNYVDKKGGSQQKVHACPPRGGGSLNIHVDKKLEKKYRRIIMID